MNDINSIVFSCWDWQWITNTEYSTHVYTLLVLYWKMKIKKIVAKILIFIHHISFWEYRDILCMWMPPYYLPSKLVIFDQKNLKKKIYSHSHIVWLYILKKNVWCGTHVHFTWNVRSSRTDHLRFAWKFIVRPESQTLRNNWPFHKHFFCLKKICNSFIEINDL